MPRSFDSEPPLAARRDPVIEVRALTKLFGRKRALDALDLRVEPGGILGVVGSNGAGKSTLFRILLGLETPTAGSSRVLGVPSGRLGPRERSRIALVHEEHSLPDWMQVEALRAMQEAQYAAWSEATYREVLAHFRIAPDQKVGQLSRGERAGLALALALAQRPALLILDEPTLGIDVVAKQAFLDSLLFVGEETDRTIVYCSHQMDEIERVADRLLILEQGRLAELTTTEELAHRVRTWVLPPTAPFDPSILSDLLRSQRIDGQLHVTLLDASDQAVAALDAVGVEGAIGFDRAVNAYLERDHAAPSSGSRGVA